MSDALVVVERLIRGAVFDEFTPRPAVDIVNEVGGSLSDTQLIASLNLLGVNESTEVWAGWWIGWNNIADCETVLGKPVGEISLMPTSDLEWRLWRTLRPSVVAATGLMRQSPGVLLRVEDPSWVLTTSPTAKSTHLHAVAPQPGNPD